MAKITPIDIIKGVSRKIGGGNSKEYFATNKCSYHIYLAKRVNSYVRGLLFLRSTSVQPPFILRSSSVHPPFNLRSSSVQPPFILCSTSVHPLFNLRSSSVQPPFNLRSTSVRAPFGLRSSSVQAPFELRSISVRAPFELRSGIEERTENDRRIIGGKTEMYRLHIGIETKGQRSAKRKPTIRKPNQVVIF